MSPFQEGTNSSQDDRVLIPRMVNQCYVKEKIFENPFPNRRASREWGEGKA